MWGDGLFLAAFALGFALMAYGLMIFSQQHSEFDDDHGQLFAGKSFIAGAGLMSAAGLYRLYGALGLPWC